MRVLFYLSASGRSPVEEFIQSLANTDKARFAEVHRCIQEFGLNSPRVTFKQLRGKLWEIRFTATGGGYRICYVMIEIDRMVWLHVFKKTTQKTPKRDLELAERRLREVL